MDRIAIHKTFTHQMQALSDMLGSFREDILQNKIHWVCFCFVSKDSMDWKMWIKSSEFWFTNVS